MSASTLRDWSRDELIEEIERLRRVNAFHVAEIQRLQMTPLGRSTITPRGTFIERPVLQAPTRGKSLVGLTIPERRP